MPRPEGYWDVFMDQIQQFSAYAPFQACAAALLSCLACVADLRHG